jgi:hypothetical protein
MRLAWMRIAAIAFADIMIVRPSRIPPTDCGGSYSRPRPGGRIRSNVARKFAQRHQRRCPC